MCTWYWTWITSYITRQWHVRHVVSLTYFKTWNLVWRDNLDAATGHKVTLCTEVLMLQILLYPRLSHVWTLLHPSLTPYPGYSDSHPCNTTALWLSPSQEIELQCQLTDSIPHMTHVPVKVITDPGTCFFRAHHLLLSHCGDRTLQQQQKVFNILS